MAKWRLGFRAICLGCRPERATTLAVTQWAVRRATDGALRIGVCFNRRPAWGIDLWRIATVYGAFD